MQSYIIHENRVKNCLNVVQLHHSWTATPLRPVCILVCWGLWSSGVWCCAAREVVPSISKDHSTSIFRVKFISWTVHPKDPLKCWNYSPSDSITSHSLQHTVVETSNLWPLCDSVHCCTLLHCDYCGTHTVLRATCDHWKHEQILEVVTPDSVVRLYKKH
jgi:hypothetical protein